MSVEQLRLKHPRLVYKSYDIVSHDGTVTITHKFLLEPDIEFHPTVTIPYAGVLDGDALRQYAFHLGLVEAISYWKAACPKEFIVEAGILSGEQIRFWYDLFIHGLGEFFYRNNIDFTQKDFLKISSSAPSANQSGSKESLVRVPGQFDSDNVGSDLVLVGGGKDSAVTLGMLATSDRTIQTMIVNPTEAALSNVRSAGMDAPIIVTRTIDQTLLELNNQGYLNGHTPFSAYLAFLGVTVGYLYGNEHIVVSNERSANEGNVVYRGMEVNHQYSKSFRFEELFRTYAATYLDGAPSYFSSLRPLNDIQIGMMFAHMPNFFRSFRSCNVGSKSNVWCGACAKCAFTYLTLFPFVPYSDMMEIFGRDYLTDPVILKFVEELVGLTPVKPFECVGTRDESKLAVVLSVEKYMSQHKEIPEGLLKIKSDLGVTDVDRIRLQSEVIENWGDTYNLPPEYLAILRDSWQRVSEKM